jgi:hypothetical protein
MAQPRWRALHERWILIGWQGWKWIGFYSGPPAIAGLITRGMIPIVPTLWGRRND